VSHWYHQRGTATGTRARTPRVYPVVYPADPPRPPRAARSGNRAVRHGLGPAGRFAGWLTELAAPRSLPSVRGCAAPRVPARRDRPLPMPRCVLRAANCEELLSTRRRSLLLPGSQARRTSTASASTAASRRQTTFLVAVSRQSRRRVSPRSPLAMSAVEEGAARCTRGLADCHGAAIGCDAGGPESERILDGAGGGGGGGGDDYRRS